MANEARDFWRATISKACNAHIAIHGNYIGDVAKFAAATTEKVLALPYGSPRSRMFDVIESSMEMQKRKMEKSNAA